MGVSGTDPNDALAPFSNSGPSVFLAAPATDIQTTAIGDAYTIISGTSASAAIVAGAAAFMKAVDPTLSNGVIVGRLARMADPAGTQIQTGNGRINMARALADTGTDFVQPAGAPPVGGGGPFVGPYVAAALSITPTVGAQPGPLTYGVGGPVTYTITISSNGNGSQTTTPSVSGLPSGVTGTFSPSGSVTCNNANTPVCTVNSFTLTVTTLNATAAGSTNFTVTIDRNATGTLTIGKATSTTTLTSNINPSLAGQSVTFTATVSGSGPTPPSGTVTFRDTNNTNMNCNNVALTGAQATCTISTLSIGSHSITATYNNDTNYNGSSDTLTQIVRRATSTTVTTSQSPSIYGQSVTFTATVIGTGAGSGTPGAGQGTVAFTDGATPITGCGAQPLNASGQATCPTTALGAGNHTINAVYSGTTTGATQFAPSSGSVAQTVNQASQTITFGALSNRTYGDAPFTVSATGGASGTAVTFAAAPASVCTAGGTNGNTIAIVRAGTCTVTASQAGDSNYLAAADVPQSFSVNKALLTVTADNKSREYGDANPVFTASYGGFKNGETLATSGVTGSPSLTTAATATSLVAGSPYAIVAAQGTLAAGNYTFTFVNGQLTITKATLTVTADNKTREYGDANPAFTASYGGFKNRENLAPAGGTGSPSLTTGGTRAGEGGGSPYAIVAAHGGLAGGD